MKECVYLFLVFSKIGLFTLGGGYAMLPLMEKELVGRWLNKEDFLDAVALAQTSSGIMAVNMAILSGYKVKGTHGSVWAASGAVLPSFIIILLLALFFANYQNNPVVRRIFMGVRPAVIALILVPVFNLSRAAKITYKTIWIVLLTAALVWIGNISPVYLILLAGLGGYLWGRKK